MHTPERVAPRGPAPGTAGHHHRRPLWVHLGLGEFIYALTFISTTELTTVTTGVVVDLIRGDFFYWGSLMGGALVASLPVVLLFALFFDQYVAGLTAGAVRG